MKKLVVLLLLATMVSCAATKFDRKYNKAEKQTIKDLKKMGYISNN